MSITPSQSLSKGDISSNRHPQYAVNVYIYMFVYICTYVHTQKNTNMIYTLSVGLTGPQCIIHIYTGVYIYMYTYIYVYIYMYIPMCLSHIVRHSE